MTNEWNINLYTHKKKIFINLPIIKQLWINSLKMYIILSLRLARISDTGAFESLSIRLSNCFFMAFADVKLMSRSFAYETFSVLLVAASMLVLVSLFSNLSLLPRHQLQTEEMQCECMPHQVWPYSHSEMQELFHPCQK